VGALLHLGATGFADKETKGGETAVIEPSCVGIFASAAELLGVSVELLTKSLTERVMTTMGETRFW